MPKNYKSKRAYGGGTGTQQAAGTPMTAPGATAGGGGGTVASYRGQPTATGERGQMAACSTPNELQELVNKPTYAMTNKGK